MIFSYSLNSIITNGKYKGRLVKDIVNDKDAIKTILKEGGSFDDEVLKIAGFRKNVRDVSVINEIAKHETDKNKKYTKETKATVSKIIMEMENEQWGNEYYDDGLDKESIDADDVPFE